MLLIVTGAEIVAAGKAVEIIGQKVLGQDEQTRNEILQVARETPEFRAAARSAAARIAVKERVRLMLWQPFARMIGVSEAYFEDVFPDEMSAKIAAIPEDQVVTPPASIAVPALQGLSYTFEESDLRELYLNLLTTASDGRRADQAHPAFAEVIKQLSAKESTLLNGILPSGKVATVQLIDGLEGSSYEIILSHLLRTVDVATGAPIEDPQVPVWIDNWNRLGLIEVSYEHWFVDETRYDWVTQRPEYLRRSEDPSVKHLNFNKGLITVTAFGKRFFRAVSPPGVQD